MKILLNVLADRITANGNDYAGLPFDEVNIKIKQGTKVIVDDDLETATSALPLRIYYLNDNNGLKREFFLKRHRYNTTLRKGTVELNISLARITDSCTFTIELTHNNYFMYANTFTVFGYDLGNDINFDTTDGTFTGLPDGLQNALINNAFNPIFAIDNVADVPIYGEDSDDNSVVRHNPSFNIGMIPVEVDNGSGTMVPNDLRYGTSGRFIAI